MKTQFLSKANAEASWSIALEFQGFSMQTHREHKPEQGGWCPGAQKNWHEEVRSEN